MAHHVAVIAGDGIGPEVVGEALKVVAATGVGLDIVAYDLGGARYRRDGEVLPEGVLDELRQADAILLGAVGTPGVAPGVIERGLLLRLRFELDLFVNLRPFSSPSGLDFVVVRENTEGIYAGEGGFLRRGTPHEVATQGSVNTRMGVERCVRFAFALAEDRPRRHLTLVHKTNVLNFAGDLWQRTFDEAAAEHPDVVPAYAHVDAACIHLVDDPGRFDVIVTDNLFGDILTDLAGAVSGGIGSAASANLNPARTGPSLFEPVHGSAPDLAGTGRANPIAAILSAAMMLEFLGEADAGARIRKACADASPPAHGATTSQIGDAVAERVLGATMPLQTTDKIWMDGELVAWEDATVHILTHSLHYGCGVFEGIRAYATDRGPAVFRLTDHMKRLYRSAKVFLLNIPFTLDQLIEANKETVRVNDVESCYIRPLVYLGYGEMGLNPLPCPVKVSIAVWPWGTYLGDEGIAHGVRMKISSWQRHDANALPPAAKATAGYINSSMAKVEALNAGYDEAILLSPQGMVSECTGENIFIVKDGAVYTPPLSAGALEGITQDSVRTIARDLGIDYHETNLVRSDLYTAEEAFLSGTAAEVVPIRSVDDRAIGEPGPITRRIQELFNAAVRGQVDQYKDWNEYVDA
ncbi:hypothetical protein BH18ACT4_BH18ACT4_11340 [soil metagenome]